MLQLCRLFSSVRSKKCQHGTYFVIHASQITRFKWPTCSPPGSCRPRVGPMLAPWTLLSGWLPFCVGLFYYTMVQFTGTFAEYIDYHIVYGFYVCCVLLLPFFYLLGPFSAVERKLVGNGGKAARHVCIRFMICHDRMTRFFCIDIKRHYSSIKQLNNNRNLSRTWKEIADPKITRHDMHWNTLNSTAIWYRFPQSDTVLGCLQNKKVISIYER